MILFLRKILFVFLTIFIFSCQSKVDVELEKRKIQAQMDPVEEAHFNKNASQFLAPKLDTFYDIRNGTFQKVSKVDQIPEVQSYFDNMEFLEHKKNQEPVIEVSDDGTMASYIGAVTVKGRLENVPVFWVFSWQSVLKKFNDDWRIISTANTETQSEHVATAILRKVKEELGSLDDSGSIYAMADCKGPTDDFKTLVLSRRLDGRMEQLSSDGHMILKHGASTSWTQDLTKQDFNDNPGEMVALFVKGHEFHWLSLRPEDRLNNPIFKGFDEFDGQTSFKIEFKDSLDRPVYFYYSFDSYLPLGFEYPTGQGDEKVTTHFANWTTVNKIKVFQKITIDEGNHVWEYNFTEIKINGLKNRDFESKVGSFI